MDQASPKEPQYGALADDALIERLVAGDSGAFEELVRELGPRLLRTATRILTNASEAQDCLQDTFIQIHQKIGSFRGESKLSTWIHRILVNNCLMKLRKRKQQSTISIDELSPYFDVDGCRVDSQWSVPENIEDKIESQKLSAFVLAAINELPELYRTVVVLRDIEEYSTIEAAESLSLSEATLKVRLHRARAALKELLDRNFTGFVT